MPSLLLAVGALVLAVIPAVVFVRNLRFYTAPPSGPPPTQPPQVSVLIPARNEERGIRTTVAAVLASEGVAVEVLVLDDHSTDRTATVVAGLARHDSRVRLLGAPPLPAGWCGKTHACAVLAREARYPLLLFLDADVRLAPDALRRTVHALGRNNAALASGFPREHAGTFAEQLVIPLIHFLLLGFLPLWRMRGSVHPAYAAGCGQMFIARRDAYERVGGHGAIFASLHDGITLPRAFRAAGFMTDVFDATELAECRMYYGAAEVWRGFAKNAHEGMATPTLILPATVLLAGGQILPFVLLARELGGPGDLTVLGAALLGTLAAYLPRIIGASRFRQSWLGALFHPCGVGLVLLIQWYACARRLLRLPAVWKGRSYLPGASSAGGG